MPFSDEELALLEAIHADPKNDAPRLAYAEWCAGHELGDLAEFIRIQCQMPYFKLDTADDQARASHDTWRAKFDEPGMVQRGIELLNLVYGSPRFPKLRSQYWEEYIRGLPLYQDEMDDYNLKYSAEELNRSHTPLARFNLTIRTARLAEWLAHPFMARVDRLQVEADFPDEAKRDADWTMNSHYDKFWAENIPVLAASPIIDRLEELNPVGCDSTLVRTEASSRNIQLCERLLEPRVHVVYDY